MARKARALNTILALAVGGVGIGGYILLRKDDPNTTTTRSVNTVQRGTVQASVTASGTLAAKQQADITFDSAVSAGVVQAINVKVGDIVTAGQPLASIDPTNAQAATAKADNDLRSAEVALAKAHAAISVTNRDTAEQSLIDARDLVVATEADLAKAYESNDEAAVATIVPLLTTYESEYRTIATGTAIAASNAISAAEVVYKAAQVTRATARKNLVLTTMVAPFAGTITAVNGVVGRAGSYTGTTGTGAGAGSAPFVQIADLSGFEVKAGFSETDAAKLQAGQAATIAIDSLGARVVARVRQIDTVSTTVNNVVTYYAYLAIDQPPANATLRPGQTANVSVAAQKVDDVLFLPSAALTARGQTTTVQVALDKANPAATETREITLGLKGDTTVEVSDGLEEGDMVVTVRSRVSSGVGTGTVTGTNTGIPAGGGIGIIVGGGQGGVGPPG